jgi:hypothetical protein
MSKTQTVTRASADGLVAYTIVTAKGGVYVERVRIVARARYSLSARFHDEVSFTRWCRADDLGCQYPFLLSEVERNGRALFAA